MSHTDRLARAEQSLIGLSVGDCFGQQFFRPEPVVDDLLRDRRLPPPQWNFTDDTNMALSIFSVLRRFEFIDPDMLMESFAERMKSHRRYGAGALSLLIAVQNGGSWRKLVPAMFEGQGSYGNGAAMRIAPLGAYFADNMQALLENARIASEVTHSHSEGVAGGLAVAVATAVAIHMQADGEQPNRRSFLERVESHIPESIVREKIQKAINLPPTASVALAVSTLGNGTQISAQDTVPFALWCAGAYLDNFEEAMWVTVSGLGDRDTTCAIVGGIITAYSGIESIPTAWRERCEPLPRWPFKE